MKYQELLALAKQAKNSDEMCTLAKEKGMELSEEVANLKVFNTDSVTHINPSVNESEIKAVFLTRLCDGDKLVGESLSTDSRIKRGSEKRGKKKVNAALNRRFNEILNDFPVPFGPNGNVVISSKRITVEPVGVLEAVKLG